MNISIVCAHEPAKAVSARSSGELYAVEIEVGTCRTTVLLSRDQADRICAHLGAALFDSDKARPEPIPERDPTQPLESPIQSVRLPGEQAPLDLSHDWRLSPGRTIRRCDKCGAYANLGSGTFPCTGKGES